MTRLRVRLQRREQTDAGGLSSTAVSGSSSSIQQVHVQHASPALATIQQALLVEYVSPALAVAQQTPFVLYILPAFVVVGHGRLEECFTSASSEHLTWSASYPR